MSTDSKASVTTQVYEVYIRATPQAIWEAITSPEWTVKYGYQGAVEIELRPGGTYKALATTEGSRLACRTSSSMAWSKKPTHRESRCTRIASCSTMPTKPRASRA